MKSKISRIIITVVLILVALVVAFFAAVTITEYKPDDVETLDIQSKSEGEALKIGTTVRAVTWNIGYASLDQNADFFMDGGKGVHTTSSDITQSNLMSIAAQLSGSDCDIVALQEIDYPSTRSGNIDEITPIAGTLDEHGYTFARNFKAFVPYPIPPLGKVDSGIITFSKYGIESAERVSLPCPFSWPIRTCNLKRCLAVNYIPIKGSDKKLAFINLHLEAYDDGEGKEAQTKLLLETLNEERKKGNYVIAAGDFNQSFSNVDISMYPEIEGTWQPGLIDSKEFGKEWKLLMDNSAPTCRSLDQPYAGADMDNFQYYMIDGFIVSDNVKVESVATSNLGFMYSDHNPVTLEFKLKK